LTLSCGEDTDFSSPDSSTIGFFFDKNGILFISDDIDIIDTDERANKLETIEEDSDTPTKSASKLPKLSMEKIKLGIKKMDILKSKDHKKEGDEKVSKTPLTNGDTMDISISSEINKIPFLS
jgi:hypothetical protein